jgi:tripartite-type tricarboxylate transporter receptor subunit TctC
MTAAAIIIDRRTLVAVATTVALTSGLASSALAQAWPARPVHLVVPFAPGGSTDVVARIVGDQLTRMWGQTVVVDNKPGAGTNLGAEAVAKAKPNGYTMFIGSSSLATSRNLYRSLNYALGDLAPVSLVCRFPLLMLTSNASPATSIADFIAFARANKGKVSFASPGVGTLPHLAGELFKQMAGIEMTHVPYRGDAPALTDTMAGRVNLQIAGSAMLEQVKGGQVRGLAVTTATRVPAAPSLPTMAEGGVPGYDVAGWYGLFVPAKTPRAIIVKMHGDTVRILSDPEVQARFDQIGMVATGSSPEELGALLDSELRKWGAVIKTAEIKLDP